MPSSKTLFLISSLTILVLADPSQDQELRNSFAELEGDAAAVRDFCFQNASITLNDLKDYDKASEVPECELCFYKCFYEQIGFIQNAKVVLDVLKELPETQQLEEKELEGLTECVKALDNIQTCEDMRKIEECFKDE